MRECIVRRHIKNLHNDGRVMRRGSHVRQRRETCVRKPKCVQVIVGQRACSAGKSDDSISPSRKRGHS